MKCELAQLEEYSQEFLKRMKVERNLSQNTLKAYPTACALTTDIFRLLRCSSVFCFRAASILYLSGASPEAKSAAFTC